MLREVAANDTFVKSGRGQEAERLRSCRERRRTGLGLTAPESAAGSGPADNADLLRPRSPVSEANARLREVAKWFVTSATALGDRSVAMGMDIGDRRALAVVIFMTSRVLAPSAVTAAGVVGFLVSVHDGASADDLTGPMPVKVALTEAGRTHFGPTLGSDCPTASFDALLISGGKTAPWEIMVVSSPEKMRDMRRRSCDRRTAVRRRAARPPSGRRTPGPVSDYPAATRSPW